MLNARILVVVSAKFVLNFNPKEMVMDAVSFVFDMLKMVARACVVMLGARLRDQKNSASLNWLSV